MEGAVGMGSWRYCSRLNIFYSKRNNVEVSLNEELCSIAVRQHERSLSVRKDKSTKAFTQAHEVREEDKRTKNNLWTTIPEGIKSLFSQVSGHRSR